MLAIRTVLHPTDFSENSDFAFRLACSLARDYRALLVVVHVAEPVVPLYGDGVVISPPVVSKESLLDKLRQMLPRDPKVNVEHRLAEGDAAVEILRLAQQIQPDVIVMGTHGRTGLARLLMGSVAEKVVRKAPCPVVTVKTPLPEARTSEEPALETAGSCATVTKG